MKTCSHCKLEKDFSAFAKKTSSKSGYQSWCNGCIAVETNRRYHQNKAASRACGKRRKAAKQEWLDEIKQTQGCLICQEEEPFCLDFHHVLPENKRKDVSKLAQSKASKETMQTEIDKCIIVCSNCHRKIHKEIIMVQVILR